MHCQQCQTELSPGAHYCYSCGSQVQPQCPACQTVNPPGSNFCFSCGGSLQEQNSEPTTPTPENSPSVRVCPRCNERNELTSSYCYSCGLPLDDDGQRQSVANHVPAFALGRPGGFWIRLLAYLIDAVLLVVVFSVVWPLVSGESISSYWFPPEAANAEPFSDEFWAASSSRGGDLFSWTLDTLYFTLAIAIWATTAGKRLFRLYVVRTDGSKVGIGRALARNFAYYLSFFTLGIGFILIAFRQDKRALHDLICGTVVIRK